MSKKVETMDDYDRSAGNNSRSNKFRLNKLVNKDYFVIGIKKYIKNVYGHDFVVHNKTFAGIYPEKKVKLRYFHDTKISCRNCSWVYHRYCTKYSSYKSNKRMTRRAIRSISFILLRKLEEIDCECKNYDNYLLVNSLHRI